MRYIKSKHFVKSKFSEESSLDTFSGNFETDEDDPLSIRSLSKTFLGIVIVLLTILLPTISVLLGRPLSKGNELFLNHSIKKVIPYFVFILPLIFTLFAGPFGLLLFLILRLFYRRFILKDAEHN